MAIKKIKVGSTTHDIDAHVALNTNLDNLGGSASAGPVFMVKNVSSAGEAFVDYRSMPLNIDWGGTGGSTKLEAANSLDFWSLTEGTTIAANTNLNNITTPGNYKCSNSADSKTLINTPSGFSDTGYLFTMKVGCLPDNPTYIYQEITLFSYNTHYYRRKHGSEAWQPWSRNFNTHTVIPLENGGTGSSTTITEAPKNAIIKKINETNGTSLTYTATNKGAFYASAENGVPVFGTLPATIGGTGNDISAYPDGVLLCKQTSSSGSSYIDYYSKPLGITVGGTGMTSNPSMLVNLTSENADTVFKSSPRPGIKGVLSLEHGGTGSGTSIADAPNNAIIRKLEDDENHQLYYTATNNGALYATSENGYPQFGTLPIAQGGTHATTASGARSNLGFSYATSAPTSAPSTGAGAVCFVVDSGAALPITEGGTGASTKVNAVKNLGMYPVGSVYTTSTSTNPASYLGGTWECFDKQLKGKVWDSSSTSGFWSHNTTNVSSSTVYAYIEGHKAHFRFEISTKVEMGESAYTLGTLDYVTMGFGSFPYSAFFVPAMSDGGNAIGYCSLNYNSGVLQMVDINPKADGNTLAAGNTLYLILEMPIATAAMYDSAVDKFYWKRTA